MSDTERDAQSIITHVAGNQNSDNELFVTREGLAGVGGGHNRYVICNYDARNNPEYDQWDSPDCTILFQNGPITADNRRNGITIEALLAVCADRLAGFQSGPMASDQGARALASIQTALWALHERTLDRSRRGVLGNLEAL